ncbi:MAG: hypothetical protein M1816_004732 [Peltula sp. TS41687]|nr:MAG: hypothetical protein M1816_004732 [Peltula sp. TS41687]
MTTGDAYAIQLYLAELEFPKIFSIAVFFALFKTYGIPTISVVSTKQLADDITASKRAADTGVILTEVVLNPPTSERSITAIARMNYLHDIYRKIGKISDADMLYTLSLFALEPARWINRYEWRTLTDMELCAIGTYWKSLGDTMDIPYGVLASGKIGWKDGLHWLEELRTWSVQYEEANMKAAVSNQKVATATVDLLLQNVRPCLREISKRFVAALLEQRLRTAMMFEEPPHIYSTALDAIMNIRKLVLRYLALLRPDLLRIRFNSQDADPITGRFHQLRYVTHPWYVKPSFTTRWGFDAWITRFLGGTLPGDEGDEYILDGYHFAELGPAALKGKGIQHMEETRARLIQLGRGGCPFAF